MVNCNPRTPEGWRLVSDTMTFFYGKHLGELTRQVAWLESQIEALDRNSRAGKLAVRSQKENRKMQQLIEACLSVWTGESERETDP